MTWPARSYCCMLQIMQKGDKEKRFVSGCEGDTWKGKEGRIGVRNSMKCF